MCNVCIMFTLHCDCVLFTLHCNALGDAIIRDKRAIVELSRVGALQILLIMQNIITITIIIIITTNIISVIDLLIF